MGLRIGVPTGSGKDVARFPLAARALALFHVDDKANYTRLETVDMPEDDRAGFVASHCEVFLTRLANEEFLLDVLSFGVEVFCTEDRRAEVAVENFLRGKATRLSGGSCCCGG